MRRNKSKGTIFRIEKRLRVLITGTCIAKSALTLEISSAEKYLVRVDAERCKGCELCVVACPEKNLKLSGSLNTKGYHPVVYNFHGEKGDCTGCGVCYWVCPDFAIAEVRSLKK